MNDKLQIILIYKKILNEVYLSMINIPKVHYSFKELVIGEMFSYLKKLYLANDLSDKVSRKKMKEEVVIEFKYIASLIRVLNEYRVLGEKKYLNIVSNEQLLLKLMNSWKTI